MPQSVIQLENVSFKYYGSETYALKDINLSIPKGEWIAIIGPNGSGKSTLAKIMNGLLAPESGSVYVNGAKLSMETVWDARRSVGMVFQNPDNQFVGATVEDDVAFGLENNGVPHDEMVVRVQEALEQVRMADFKRNEPARLSGGQKQRVALASVIALRPDVIILDEATAMLDPLGRKEVIEAIEALKERYPLTVISITHDIDEAAHADQIVVMQQGQIIDVDEPSAIFEMGEDLIARGLDIPFAQKVQAALIARGIDLPEEYMTQEELVTWIRSNLNM